MFEGDTIRDRNEMEPKDFDNFIGNVIFPANQISFFLDGTRFFLFEVQLQIVHLHFCKQISCLGCSTQLLEYSQSSEVQKRGIAQPPAPPEPTMLGTRPFQVRPGPSPPYPEREIKDWMSVCGRVGIQKLHK